MRMIFMGRKQSAASALRWTIEHGIDVAFVCTDSGNPDSSTAAMSRHLGIPVISMREAEEHVKNNPDDIDLAVSFLYWEKIRKPLIEIPRYGCINFHPALLPDWRGTAGYNIAILKRLCEWGASAHYVDEEIDTGAIIRVYRFSFDYRLETAYSLEKKTQEVLSSLYRSVMLDVLEHGRLECIPQSLKQGTYISKKEMLRMMELDRYNLEHEEDLDIKIRAFWFPPYDGAGFKVNGKFYTLVNQDILRSIKSGEKRGGGGGKLLASALWMQHDSCTSEGYRSYWLRGSRKKYSRCSYR